MREEKDEDNVNEVGEDATKYGVCVIIFCMDTIT